MEKTRVFNPGRVSRSHHYILLEKEIEKVVYILLLNFSRIVDNLTIIIRCKIYVMGLLEHRERRGKDIIFWQN